MTLASVARFDQKNLVKTLADGAPLVGQKKLAHDVLNAATSPRIADELTAKGHVWARFKGWQLNSKGGKVFALFNVFGATPFAGSTVTEKSLRAMKIRVPNYEGEAVKCI